MSKKRKRKEIAETQQDSRVCRTREVEKQGRHCF
jgi:hypothetical protein